LARTFVPKAQRRRSEWWNWCFGFYEVIGEQTTYRHFWGRFGRRIFGNFRKRIPSKIKLFWLRYMRANFTFRSQVSRPKCRHRKQTLPESHLIYFCFSNIYFNYLFGIKFVALYIIFIRMLDKRKEIYKNVRMNLFKLKSIWRSYGFKYIFWFCFKKINCLKLVQIIT
jgi:hypothetical protein